MRFRVFKRKWWAKGPRGELVPHVYHRITIGHAATEEEARAMCRRWFEETYGAGPEGQERYQRTMRSHLGLKAEYERV